MYQFISGLYSQKEKKIIVDEKRKLLVKILAEMSAPNSANEGIAIVGVAGRYPLANTVGELWTNLAEGRHCIREVPVDRWSAEDHYDPSGKDGSYSKWAGFVDDVDKFDPMFFQISPADAAAMDPQERLFLEIAALTLDDAGYPAAKLSVKGPVGVFAGVMNNNYEWMGGEAYALGVQTDAHSNHWSIANRVSYIFDFTGPSLAVDTACSASLTAIHLACESIRRKECVAAVAGGVNLILHPMHLRTLANRGMISRSDRLKSFGAGADGFVDGEGVGAVLLRPLNDAIADKDRILGVIRGSAINAGGKTGGYTVPSATAQTEVIRAAISRAAIDVNTIGYVEAHGTGTPLGDPIEIAGLMKAFDGVTGREHSKIAVGSVKSNIGHLESAAGIAGLTKVLLQFRHRMLVPSLNSRELNPKVTFSETPFEVQQSLQPWVWHNAKESKKSCESGPLRALVSSFGGGGANACMVIEEFLPSCEEADEQADKFGDVRSPESSALQVEHLLVFSAKCEESLRSYAAALSQFLDRLCSHCEVKPETQQKIDQVCLRLAAESVDMDSGLLDLDSDLIDCGFGVAERVRYHNRIAAALDIELPLAVTAAHSIGAIAKEIAKSYGLIESSSDRYPRLIDIAHTLQVGRSPYEHRMAMVCSSPADLSRRLRAYTAGEIDESTVMGRAARTHISLSPGQIDDLEEALRRRDLATIADLWVMGADVDWSRLNAPGGRRIELPGYAFVRKRCWIPSLPTTKVCDLDSPEGLSSADRAQFYRPLWRRAESLKLSVARVRDHEKISVLVTERSAWLGEAIAARIPRATVDLIRIDQEITSSWLTRVVGADRLFHLGGVGLSLAGLGDAIHVRDHFRQGSLALFNVLHSKAARHITVVTSDVYEVEGSTVLNPISAGVHGLLQVAPKEHSELRIVGIDFASGEFRGQSEGLVEAILREQPDRTPRSVVLRGGTRYLRRLGRIELSDVRPVFRDGGVYLLLGGTGGIGQELSIYLARRHKARMVWFSRSELKPEHKTLMAKIRGYGGDIFHIRGDGCSVEDLSKAVAKVHQKFGPLHGVVHAAMAFDNHLLDELDEESFVSATKVKVIGATALTTAIAEESLDFLAFFSSAGSFGSFAGNGAYICASATEDAYGLYVRERLKIPVTVINQGYWGQVGSGSQPGLSEIFSGLGIDALGAAEGVDATRRILGSGVPQAMPIQASRRALEAMGHDPACDFQILGQGRMPLLTEVSADLDKVSVADPEAERVLEGYDALETVSIDMLVGVYRSMGVFGRSGERYQTEELRVRLGILDKFQRLHEALLNILVESGFLTRDLNRVTTTIEVERITPEAIDHGQRSFDRIAAQYSSIEPTVTLNRLFLRSYPQILRGEVGATEIMFPGSSMKLVQNFYKGNPLTDSFNRLVGETVDCFVDRRLPQLADDEVIEVVELGAGTGATSEWILPQLAKHAGRVSYVFTDVSPHFLKFGSERFSEKYTFTRFGVLNLNRSLVEQGFIEESADLVLATNVVHATQNLRATLRRAKALLRPGGWLVLNELTMVRPLLTIGGGVLEGWWKFDDGNLRLSDSPLASPQSWTQILYDEGFAGVKVLGSNQRELGQSVLVAQNDGGVRATRKTADDSIKAPIKALPVARLVTSDLIADRLRKLVEEVLQLDVEIDPDRPLSEYGFDSLSGMKIVAAVDNAFGVTVPLGEFFERPTLSELADHLVSDWLANSVATTSQSSSVPGDAQSVDPHLEHKVMPQPAKRLSFTSSSVSHVLRPRGNWEQGIYSLSEGQRALWVIEQVAPGNYAYNLPLALWLRRDLDVLALRVVLQDIVDRHEALRATVQPGDSGPLIRTAAEPELPIQQVFMTSVSEPDLRDRMMADLRRSFDLGRGPLVRATLYSLGDGRNALLLAFHHIVFDGVSISILLRDLEQRYRMVCDGDPLPSDLPARSYSNFVDWQREMLSGAEGRRLRDYWVERLRGRQTTIALPLDRAREATPGFRGASVEGHISKEVTECAKSLAAEERTSLFTVMLASYFALLHRYSDQVDVSVGIPTSGRPSRDYDDVLGYFMNMVVVAERVDGAETFRSFVRRTHHTNLSAIEHSTYPLISLIEELQRNDPGQPVVLFNVAFYFQNWVRKPSQENVVLGAVEGVHQEGEFDLTLEIVEQIEGCRFSLKYNPDLFDESTVERIGRHFVTLLTSAVAASDRTINELELLTEEEKKSLTLPASVEYPNNRLVWELVQEQARSHPDAIAIRCNGVEHTYRQLMDKVQVFANRLRALGVGRGRLVGVLLPRDCDLPAVLLAVQAAGGAYVPLDPTYPEQRLAYMIEDAELHLVVSHSSLEREYGATRCMFVDRDDEHLPRVSSPGRAGTSDPAYVIYTSGSTGRPKGVVVPHSALVNFLCSMAQKPGFAPGDTLLALTTICFDISGLELYLPLIAGGTIEILPSDVGRDGIRLREAIECSKATIIQATPSTWSMLIAAGWKGNPTLKVLCGGEALSADVAEILLDGNQEVWNLYGPTETTIWSSVAQLARGQKVTIGTPIANTQLHVLDSGHRILPVGVAGELYIGGHGVSQGYFRRPDLTSERFIPDPFSSSSAGRMYRTGDLVRRLANGCIEYLGRIDSQIKLRGFRVELEEIETTLRRIDGVREAVVVARAQPNGHHSLMACYVLVEGATAPTREQLAAWLPDHMVPDVLIGVSGFPRTLNEKVDRTTLASLSPDDIRARFGTATFKHEGKHDSLVEYSVEPLVDELAELVAPLVGLRPSEIGVRTPLGEVGMNSVSFTALSSELRKAYGIEVYPTLFYRRSTLVALAEHLWDHHSRELAVRFGRGEGTVVECTKQGSWTRTKQGQDSDNIAIIGMAGRLPGSMDLHEFWDHLVAGDDLIREIPAERWDWKSQPASRSHWGGFVPNVDCFDAAFFGISPREAELMDPQQRLLLEVVWSTIEDAGYNPREFAGKRVGVFMAVTNSDYLDVQRSVGRGTEGHTLTGVALSVIPNRISYVFDFRGPSIAVDTACSGSLTATYQACAALRDGTCDLAIAGGVSLILSPSVYEALSRGEMLSPDGRCMAFDSRANGYVRGEGVGAVLLKPAQQAQHDDDAIHAVIKAVAINHGGRTASLTAPNPDAQADLLVEAYEQARIPLETVGYIEAHGTGTALGDPIESMGLSTAFRRLSSDRENHTKVKCAIGSVKTNIGHLEAAAGIAGLFKVVLALRHAKIPASLHFEDQNPYLELDEIFEVAATTRPWSSPRDIDGHKQPRRGGVSSFGFGGANAHIVLEESNRRDTRLDTSSLQLVVLSARNPEALRRMAHRLFKYLEDTNTALDDLAYTLQVGREAMAHRLAVVAQSTAGLRAELDEYLAGRPSAICTGQAKDRQSESTSGDLMDIATDWVRGVNVDWSRLHVGSVRRRVHLPTYSFAATKHWIVSSEETYEATPEVAIGRVRARLHPSLLDVNVSTFDEQAFVKVLTKDDFYLCDHVVGGELVLPGVVYGEMARLAGELASRGSRVRGIDQLVWAAPVRLSSVALEHELVIRLKASHDGASFEVQSTEPSGTLHARGTLLFGEQRERPDRVDLAALRTRCSRVYDGESCYLSFSRLGFDYGPSFQAIEEFFEGDQEALAKLRLPVGRRADAEDYVFHPSLFDAALQTAGRLAPGSAAAGSPLPFLPYSVGSVRLYAPLPEQVYAYARPSDQPIPDGMLSFDVSLLDQAGDVIATVEAFMLRAVPTLESVHAFEPRWKSAPSSENAFDGSIILLDPDAQGNAVEKELKAAGFTVQRFEIGGKFDAEVVLREKSTGPICVVHLAGRVSSPHREIEQCFFTSMAFIQRWQRTRRKPLRYLYVYPESEVSPASGAMSAFARSLHLEQPSIEFGVVCVSSGTITDAIISELGAEFEPEVRVDETGRNRRYWHRTKLPPASDSAFRGSGAHIITGGTGALGLLLAEHIATVRHAAQQYDGGIILVSRSAPGEQARVRIEAIGAQVVQADITDSVAVQSILSDARRVYGKVSGVLHVAGVLRDGLLLHKSRSDAESVLAAKVHGTILLDEATKNDALDYFVGFSSAAAVFGNVGQTDYAFANAFLDHFAHRRELQRLQGIRHGRTFAAAWPVWVDGGMRIDDDAMEYMDRVLGMRALETRAAIDALERALGGTAPRLLLAPGRPSQIESILNAPSARTQSSAVTDTVVSNSVDGRIKAETLVLELLAKELKLPVSDIVVTESFDRFGVDSLITMSVIRGLEEHFGSLSKTLLFEYVTVRELAEYLASSFADVLADPVASDSATDQKLSPEVASPVGLESTRPLRTTRRTSHDDIAIIGVAGRYPQADDVDEFWNNLRNSRDSIEEIPTSRWDQQKFYDSDKSVFGKTYGKWGGFLRGADRFDPMFFRMSQIEAEHTDPQERVFLETVWHLLEDAGYTRRRLNQCRTGVFVGMMYGHYQLYGVQDALHGKGFATSSSYASVANRVSYFFDFNGPSVALDTMCSSSLVTIHQACLSIRNGDCEIAVAGGVNISSHPLKFLQLAQRRFLAEDGRCRSFGEGGTGYVPAEGSGAVLLKRLDAALADNDRVLAIVKSSAVNHGGAGAGYSVPNPKAQGDLIRVALERAGLHPAELDYIEAHGTGTALGDPVEITGMLRAFEEDMPERIAIGSVKSNIGHAESAAGVAAITKVLLQMQHGELVPSLHSSQLNENIDFTSIPFDVQHKCEPWSRGVLSDGSPRPRTAGVSSFGAGGTNAHIILQEYLGESGGPDHAALGPHLAVLSAKDADRLVTLARRLAQKLGKSDANIVPQKVAWTLQMGREAMEHRLALLFSDLPELVDRLREFAAGGKPAKSWTGVVNLRKAVKSDTLVADPEIYARAWISGQKVDWSALHPMGSPGSVALPGYPFEGERIWLAAADAELVALGAGPKDASDAEQGVLLTRHWIPADPIRRAPRPKRTAVLVSSPSEPLAAVIAEKLPFAEVLTTERLAADLADPGTQWDRFDAVVDLAGCVEQTQSVSQSTLFTWLQWLQRVVASRHTLCSILVSRRVSDDNGRGAILGSAARVGLYRMLQSEYRHLRSRHIDVGAEASDQQIAQWTIDELVAEGDPAEVAYRDGVRYRSELHELPNVADVPFSFPANHVLWVTGGTRGIGLLSAQHFVANHGVRKLVLTGRQQLPPPETWAEHIDADSELGRKLRPLAELMKRGVQLEVLAVPLDDKNALSARVREIGHRMGPAGGLIHSAGFTDFENPAFVRKPHSSMAQVIGPKIFGLDGLVECFRNEPLSMFVLYSSVAATVPALAVGQSDYALANAYLDEVAESRPYGLPLVSIQWPSWKETGMGEARSAAYQASGLATLSNEQGLALLERALRGGARVVLPAMVKPGVQWSPERLTMRRLEVASTTASKPVADVPDPEIVVTTKQESIDSATVVRAVEGVSSWLLDQLATELRFDRARLEGNVPIPDYGIDSIMVSQLIQTVAKRLGVSIDPSALLEHPTTDGFATYLAKEHQDALVEAFSLSRVDSAAPDKGTVHISNGVKPNLVGVTPNGSAGGSLPVESNKVVSTAEPSAVMEWGWGFDDAPAEVNPSNSSSEASAVVERNAEPVSSSSPRSTLQVLASSEQEIAVIGLSCRFPGAQSVSEYWDLLRRGQSALRPIPTHRFGRDVNYHAGLLDDVLRFDPEFFLLAESDVIAMDPQALVLLEEVVRAVFHAGYRLGDLKERRVGVYVGGRANHTPEPTQLKHAKNPVVVTGQNYLSANISQFLDVRGPSLVVDTACSSPLVAMNMAIQSLHAGDIESAIVAGVSLLADDRAHQVFGHRGLLNPGSEFHVFDRRAAGLVLGEGVGVVLLKPLSQARADGDQVLSVIKGIAVNNDGRTAGPATPNLQAQKDVMLEALRRSGCDPSDIGWVETNGSGSMITDLLELKAVESVYRERSLEPLFLGSIKPNIGHPLAAEGIAAFIKLVMMLNHREQVPFLSGQEPLDHFDMEASSLYFPRESRRWPDSAKIAALNCFADGGTNVHLLMAPRPEDYQSSRPSLRPPTLNRTTVIRGVIEPSQPRSTMFWEDFQ